MSGQHVAGHRPYVGQTQLCLAVLLLLQPPSGGLPLAQIVDLREKARWARTTLWAAGTHLITPGGSHHVLGLRTARGEAAVGGSGCWPLQADPASGTDSASLRSPWTESSLCGQLRGLSLNAPLPQHVPDPGDLAGEP